MGGLDQTPEALEAAAGRWQRYQSAGRRIDADRVAQQLIEALAPMIARHVRPWLRSPSVDARDLEQAARVAVIGALERYQPGGGASFKTFVFTAIRGGIANAARTLTGGDIHQPAHVREARRKVRKAREALTEDATVEQIALAAGVPVNTVLTVLSSEHTVRETVRFGDYTDLKNGVINPERHPAVAVEWTEAADNRIALQSVFYRLPPSLRLVLARRYGDEPETLEEIAASLGISREAVRQREQRGLAHLRRILTVEPGSTSGADTS